MMIKIVNYKAYKNILHTVKKTEEENWHRQNLKSIAIKQNVIGNISDIYSILPNTEKQFSLSTSKMPPGSHRQQMFPVTSSVTLVENYTKPKDRPMGRFYQRVLEDSVC